MWLWTAGRKPDIHPAIEFARQMESLHVKTIVYTDIATDGMMKGPNLHAMREMVVSVNMAVIASGGVSCVADLLALKKAGAAGAITGKAIYTGAFDVREALDALK